MKVVRYDSSFTTTEVIVIDHQLKIIDIDSILIQTNNTFYNRVVALGLEPTFDFTKSINKKLYTHEFIFNVCEHIKSNQQYKLCFYKNTSTITLYNKFRDQLVKKLKSIFGFSVIENVKSFELFIDNLIIDSCEEVSNVDNIINSNSKPKSFKYIRKYLEKYGLSYLNNQFFQNENNKMMILS